tara:strand:- start:25 stop:366 length:342 start_codon:yes stop_codon:yes gene_type:complete
MVKKSVIKAGAKLLKKAKPKGMLKVKPYAKFKSEQAKLAKRKAKIMGEPMPTKAAKKPGFKSGVAAGATATLAYQEIKKGQKAAKAKENEKLKKSIEKHREKDKKKKEKHHSR